MQALTRAGESFDVLVYRRMKNINREGKTEQQIYDEAVDEVIASACEKMLENSKVAEDIANEVAKQDMTLGQRMLKGKAGEFLNWMA